MLANQFLVITHVTCKKLLLICQAELRHCDARGVQAKQEQLAVEVRFLYGAVTPCHGSLGGGTELKIGES